MGKSMMFEAQPRGVANRAVCYFYVNKRAGQHFNILLT
jgi:hypothetical protein